MLLRSMVVVTTFIGAAVTPEIMISDNEKIIMIFFMICFKLFLILMCTVCTYYKYPTQPKLAIILLNINIGLFAFKFYFLKFGCQPACSQRIRLFDYIFVERFLSVVISSC